MLTAAVAPVDTLSMDRELAGPSGNTKESCCDGADPVMLTAAVAPVDTLSMDKELAGPDGPWGPV
jgi:hypothetical protein